MNNKGFRQSKHL